MSILNSVLQNRYQIQALRGQDASGQLYRAIDSLSETSVSLKGVRFTGEGQLKKLEAEARELMKAQSPALARVRNFFREGDLFFLVSDFIEADDLAKVLAGEGLVLSPYQAMHWGMQIAAALKYLHNQEFSLIQGNIRLQNVKLLGDSIILQDFGLAASFAGPAMPKPNPDFNVRGFLSPEQATGRVEPLSDIYSLGATLYNLIAGVIPPDGAKRAAAVKRGETDPLLPLRALNPQAPVEIARIVMQAMELDPYQRRWGPISAEIESAVMAFVAGAQSANESRETSIASAQIPDSLVTPGSSTTKSVPSDFAAEPPPPYLDENVQFTVYRPKTIVPQKWHSLLAFAHLSEKREDAGEDEPDPVKEVRKQAQAILGEQAEDYQNVTQDTLQAIPREGTLTFVPAMPGIEFNPPSRSFVWEESVHREEFRVRAAADRDRSVVKGRLSVFLGSILLADIPLSIRVDSRDEGKRQKSAVEQSHARPYRKIFASYSHKDTDVVKQFEHYLEALGDKYLRDVTYLRAGETWNEKLEEMIVKADIFQLFWSSNSMNSPFVRQEWEYALSLQRPNFIRPTYWEEPLPNLPDQKLPPEELKRLHFQRLYSSDDSQKPIAVQTEARMQPAASEERARPRGSASREANKKETLKARSPRSSPESSGRAGAASKRVVRRDDSLEGMLRFPPPPPSLQDLMHTIEELKQSGARQTPVPPAPTSSPEVSSRTNSASKEGSRPSEPADALEVFWDKRPRETPRKGVGGLEDALRYEAPRRRGVGGGREEIDTSSFPPHMRVYLPPSSRSGAGGSSGAFGDLGAVDRLEAGRSGGAGSRLIPPPNWNESDSARTRTSNGPLVATILVVLGLLAVLLYFLFG